MQSIPRRLAGRLILFFTFLTVTSISFAGDWPGFRGPNFDGSANDGKFSGDGSLAVLWRAPIGSGYSGISILGNRAVTMFSDGTNDVAAAFDTDSGKELWRYKIGPTYKGHDGSHDGPIATPAIAGGKVFGVAPRGELFAIDLQNGKEVWKANILENHGGKKPFYGFGASPLVVNGVLVVEIGAEGGKAVAGFNPENGERKWTAGDDGVNYQSPLLLKAGDRDLLIAVGDKKLIGIEPSSGKVEWEYLHDGDDSAGSLVPVPSGEGRLFLRPKSDSSEMIRVVAKDGKITTEKLWTAPVLRNSLSIPVYHNGYLYGYNGRVMSCVDAATGELKWRARGPGDGFLLLVDGNLVVQTKQGTVHVAQASTEGWKEKTQLALFKDISWTPPSYAGGTVFTRSHKELARLEWRTQPQAAAISTVPTSVQPPSAMMSGLISEIQKAQDKKAAVEKFFASVKSFPVVEWPDRIHFFYRGEANDLAIAGEMFGSQKEEPMKRIEGTDVFYYSMRVEPDARMNYRFMKNFDEMIFDPLNTRKTEDSRGNPFSWFAMPGWKEPVYLKEAPADRKGTIESKEITSKLFQGGSAKFDVYLPAGYKSGKDRYPVIYIYDGPVAQKLGMITNTLDNLSGNSIRPVIAVLISETKTSAEPRQGSDSLASGADLLAKEIVPFVDANYRTETASSSRAVVGTGGTGMDALYAAFFHPQVFGNVATQSVFFDTVGETPLRKQVKSIDEQPLRVYMDWGLYDLKNVSEGWDLRPLNRDFSEFLRERGFKPAGGEVHEGAGWSNWRNRSERWLTAFFPITQS